ncbi:MAG: XrtA system polysaccharide deacetylase [Candidatus Binatia bacterium]
MICEHASYRSAAPVNAITVDVEDYFQVSAFERNVSRDNWERLPSRVQRNTDRILELFDRYQAHATFFILGWIGDRFPQMVREIAEAGHEIASHGRAHVRATEQNPDQFGADIRYTKQCLEDITGQKVLGYRAASFSIGAKNLWALDVIQQSGYRYSSSIYPVYHDLYGMPEAPRFPFRIHSDSVLEIPATTVDVLGYKLPCAGGGYFRLMPYPVSRWALRRVNRRDQQSAVFYFHPWEIDPAQPRVSGIGYKTRFRHYFNLDRMERRLARLLGDFTWDRMDRIFLQPRMST